MRIRPAVPEDAMAVARVHVCAWQAAYRGLLPDAYLNGLRPEDRAEKYNFDHGDLQQPHTLVAEVEGRIIGFATTRASHDTETTGYGELCALYLDPEYWGCGFGSALHAAACAHLRSSGFEKAVLWVMVGNARAERFYEAMGWRTDGTQRQDTVWDVAVDEVRYVKRLDEGYINL